MGQLSLSWLEMDKPKICMVAKFALDDYLDNAIKCKRAEDLFWEEFSEIKSLSGSLE